jgi:hypothetical protein
MKASVETAVVATHRVTIEATTEELKAMDQALTWMTERLPDGSLGQAILEFSSILRRQVVPAALSGSVDSHDFE